jgi:phenylalanyl-tRNA synthetase beta chain
MKISLNTIRFLNEKFHSAGDPAPEGVNALVEKIGSQLGEVEETIEIGKKYDGVIIVKVVSCEKHPDADRLHVCMVDDGGVANDAPRDEDGLVQVVCGAPNVKAGVTVAWLPPGATVPSTYDNDPFVLEARELRGVVSNGMLASPKELAIGDSHEGLLLIDEDVAPGTPFAEYFNLKDDVVIDIENKMFTHRPDCFGWIGVAREIAGIQGQKFTSPEWYRSDASIEPPQLSTLPLEVRNEIPELVPRFTAVALSDVSIGPSPVWLQVALSKYGLRPISNIVDLTNYYMLLTGQPLHAYDYDKVRALDGGDKATLVVRKPHDAEKLTLLNGKEIEPRKDAIMIATESQAIGLGGVMGGGNTEVDERYQEYHPGMRQL